MPSKHRFRALAALCIAFIVILAPQLASAGSSSRSVSPIFAKASSHHSHQP